MAAAVEVTGDSSGRGQLDYPPELPQEGRGSRVPAKGVAREAPRTVTVCSESTLGAIDELEAYLDLNAVLKRAVELAKTKVGAERAAIYLCDPAAELMRGTWGTGAAGETTDERALCFNSHDTDAAAKRVCDPETEHWLVLERAPLVAHRQGRSFCIGEGWIAVTPIRSETRYLGVLFNDSALSGTPLDHELQGQLSTYCRLLGDIIEARQRHENLPNPPAAQGELSPLVHQAARALRRDCRLSGGALATRFGVSAGHLARRFKAEMAVSLVDYRNRLRIEKFCDIMDSGSERIVGAALAAGFGSYAQFHRVFCRAIGMKPRDYLGSRGLRPDGN